MTFGLDDIKAARRPLLRRLRPFLGDFLWFVQGPEVILPGRPERLGLHVLGSGGILEPKRLSEIAAASGFGPRVDVRTIDRRSNSAEDVGRYMGRHLQRDGYRLSEHHGRVDLAYGSPGWPKLGKPA